jgi:cytoskeletal protein CcmA (bactofilin family)
MSIFSSNRDSKETTPNVSTYVPPVTTPSAPAPSAQASHHHSSNSALTTISEGTTLEGQIKIEGDIKIEGSVKGTVTSKGRVIISSTGKVDGDIICQNAEIAGHVLGKLKIADILFLKGAAQIDGDINTGKLVIENGVKFNGNCTMGAPLQQTAPPKVETPVKTTVELNA